MTFTLPDTFPALRIHGQEPRSARVEEISLASLGPGELTIEVEYSAINYKDALAVTGQGAILKRFPLVGGIDLAGRIVESRAARFAAGDLVVVCGSGLGESHDGGYARYARVPGDWAVAIPAPLGCREAAALGTAGLTAVLARHRLELNGQQPDLGPLVVTGASGGVGSFAVDLLAGAGYRVVALSRKPGAARYLHELGADEVLDPEQLQRSAKPLGTARWGGVVDSVGGDLLAWLASTTVPNGNLACVGLAASARLDTTVLPLILRGVSLLGINSVYLAAELRDRLWQRLATDWRPRRLDAIVTGEVTLAQIPATCQKLLAGTHFGRTLVRVCA